MKKLHPNNEINKVVSDYFRNVKRLTDIEQNVMATYKNILQVATRDMQDVKYQLQVKKTIAELENTLDTIHESKQNIHNVTVELIQSLENAS